MADARNDLDADPTQLRAIAHPLRNRILLELSATGSGRAADLAAALDVPANQVSFHVRQLAKYGLVEEAPELARDGRDRVWRLAHRDIKVNPRELAASPGGAAAVKVFHRVARARAHAMVDAVLDEGASDEFRSQSESALRLTADEAKQCMKEVRDLISNWQERGRTEAEGRRTYLYMDLILPMPGAEEGEEAIQVRARVCRARRGPGYARSLLAHHLIL